MTDQYEYEEVPEERQIEFVTANVASALSGFRVMGRVRIARSDLIEIVTPSGSRYEVKVTRKSDG